MGRRYDSKGGQAALRVTGGSGEIDQVVPDFKSAANTALNFACATTGANVHVNAQGYFAP